MFYSEEQYWEERDSHLASPQEAVAEWASNYGSMHLDRAWLLHDWDVWVANPHYAGPKVPHPESDWEGPYEEEGVEPPGFDDPKSPEGPAEFDPGADYEPAMKSAWPDDDIPF